VAGHAEDIVMYDVPPPYRGVIGIEAYARTWPPFFAWQAAGATFELAEVDITSGDTVAYAHALLRCGTPEELAGRPERLLRLTLGLRKEEGGWVVAHEHHSFPYEAEADTGDQEASEREIRELHRRWFEATAERDLDALMEPIAETVVSYEHEQPLEYVGRDRVREICADGLDTGDGTVTWTVPDMQVIVRDELAVSWGLNRMAVHEDGAEVVSWSRGTRVFQRTGQGWRMIHQHVSFPFDPATGHARTDLAPTATDGK
jgi:ketosteroid isomerase-like protein